jgi:hypothetical protein
VLSTCGSRPSVQAPQRFDTFGHIFGIAGSGLERVATISLVADGRGGRTRAVTLGVVLLLVLVGACGPRPPSRATVGRALPDGIGPPPALDAHDGSLVQDGITFWFYGTAYQCGFALATIGTPWCGIRAFSSTDLLHWSPRGYAVAPDTLWQQRCAPPRFGCFRPHVARSAATGQWVMWVNSYDIAAGYHVLVASSPAGPWVETASPTLAATAPAPAVGAAPGAARSPGRGDEDVFVDSTGQGWLAYTVLDANRPVDIAVERLNPELTSGTGEIVRLRLGFVEAPSLFERDGRFFLAYSDPACPYCPYAATGLAWARSPLGPWLRAPAISTRSCDGQPDDVARLQLAGDPVWLYLSDRWDPGKANQAAARTWWEPLTFGPDGMPVALSCGR